MAQHQKFWMVWNPSATAPTYKHFDKKSATEEAHRLSQGHPDNFFFVLKSVGGFISTVLPPQAVELLATAEPDQDMPW